MGQQQAVCPRPPAHTQAFTSSALLLPPCCRLAEDRAFLLQAIPEHPPEGELDWELIARHFGRCCRPVHVLVTCLPKLSTMAWPAGMCQAREDCCWLRGWFEYSQLCGLPCRRYSRGGAAVRQQYYSVVRPAASAWLLAACCMHGLLVLHAPHAPAWRSCPPLLHPPMHGSHCLAAVLWPHHPSASHG